MTARAWDERGSAVLFVPVTFLILLMLGALMINASAAFVAHREAQAVATGVANDLAAAGVEAPDLFGRSTSDSPGVAGVRLADQATLAGLASGTDRTSGVFTSGPHVSVQRLDDTRVRVTVTATARRGLPIAGARTFSVRASAIGTVEAGVLPPSAP